MGILKQTYSYYALMIPYLFVKLTVHILEWMYSNCPYNVLSYVAYVMAYLQRSRVSTRKKKNKHTQVKKRGNRSAQVFASTPYLISPINDCVVNYYYYFIV